MARPVVGQIVGPVIGSAVIPTIRAAVRPVVCPSPTRLRREFADETLPSASEPALSLSKGRRCASVSSCQYRSGPQTPDCRLRAVVLPIAGVTNADSRMPADEVRVRVENPAGSGSGVSVGVRPNRYCPRGWSGATMSGVRSSGRVEDAPAQLDGSGLGFGLGSGPVRCFFGQCFPRQSDDLGEVLRLVNRHLGQDETVHGDSGNIQTVDELRVAHL